MMTRENFGMGFFGRNPFDKEAKQKFQEKWSEMTDSEKLDFMNKKVESMGKDHFSVEAMDEHCEKWMKKTPEEKQAFVDKRKESFLNKMACMRHFHGHNHFDFFEEKKQA